MKDFFSLKKDIFLIKKDGRSSLHISLICKVYIYHEIVIAVLQMVLLSKQEI
jgi:hypothetical protein